MGDYKRTYRNDRGYTVDASEKLKELTDDAIARCYNEEETTLSEEEYMAALYPKNHDEYLVNGAILTCNRASLDVKIYRGRIYNVVNPHQKTFLNVTENPKAEVCGHLYHATIRDAVKDTNITPFHCNCSIEPHNDEEWDTLEADDSYKTEGTCKALMKLNVEWDNLPADVEYLRFWNEDRFGKIPGITMSSMLFCKHGGIITPFFSGQTPEQYLFEPDINDPEQVKTYVWFFFVNQGLSCEVVAGICGNVQQECGFDLPSASKQNSSRFGLFQWPTSSTDERNQKFIRWANENGLDMGLVSTQCEYGYYEMMHDSSLRILDPTDKYPEALVCSKDTLLKSQTPEEAARIFAAYFERCRTSSYIGSDGEVHFTDIQHGPDRINFAEDIYDEMINYEGE